MQREKVANNRSQEQNHAHHDSPRTHVLAPLIADLEVYVLRIRLVQYLTRFYGTGLQEPRRVRINEADVSPSTGKHA